MRQYGGSGGRGRGRGGYGGRGQGGRGRGGPGNDRKRATFTKLVKDGNATLTSIRQANRFVDGMDTFQNKSELLAKLCDERDHGAQRLSDVLQHIDTNQDVEDTLIHMLRNIINEETMRPLNRIFRAKVLNIIFMVPSLLQFLLDNATVVHLQQSSAQLLCLFLKEMAKAFIDARQSPQVRQLCEALQERGDLSDAHELQFYLGVVEQPSDLAANNTIRRRAIIPWGSDLVPPGGRHDNDFANFRNIEIIPTRAEMTCDIPPWLPLANESNRVIEDPAQRLLDKNFRLLRADAVQSMMVNIKEQKKIWRHARIVGIQCTGRDKKSFAAVSFVTQLAKRNKKINWSKARVLPLNGVVGFCRNGNLMKIGLVSIRNDSVKNDWLLAPEGPKIGITVNSDEEFDDSLGEMLFNAKLNVQINRLRDISESSSDKEANKRRIADLEAQLITYDLVEISESFFSYSPILKSLKESGILPLSEEIVGTTSSTERPDYLPATLRMPRDKNFNGYPANLNAWSTEDMVANTSLDESQAEALRHGLKKRVALIQGPPGTGKTFIGAVLAQMIRENTNASILAVCYTNHALDSFLEDMLDAGERKIVRIGGRSKSVKLAPYQLRELSRRRERTGGEAAFRMKRVVACLHSEREGIERILQTLEQPVGWSTPDGGISSLLQFDDDFAHYYNLLKVPSESDDGFVIVGANNKALEKDLLWQKWQSGDTFPSFLLPYVYIEDEDAHEQFWSLNYDARSILIQQWSNAVLEPHRGSLKESVSTFSGLLAERQEIFKVQDMEILDDARIIGVTTTGAAAYKEVLAEKQPEVLIIEEAGEVLEAHVLSSLCPSTKHVILIGDHLQLRPKVENYELTLVANKGYDLDCSLFERLVKSNLPTVRLQVQHRMRPSISTFVREQTYPDLQDHKSVKEYPDVKGISNNVVFIDHSVPEDGAREDAYEMSQTKSNQFEAEFAIEVVRYLLLQGYTTADIVVLTPYVGQLMKLIALMRSRLNGISAYISENDQRELDDIGGDDEGSTEVTTTPEATKTVRCSSVDNFQGEEAKVVVISLVRSNKAGNIGFLKEHQRVNVLLSRAKHGMYLIGSSKTLLASSKGAKVWTPLLNRMKEQGQIMKGLSTTCQLHPYDEPILLCKPTQFQQHRPNGGCCRPCAYRMGCGHACTMMCHSYDPEHVTAERGCVEPCRRFPPRCPLQHPCPKRCKDECGECITQVAPTQLLCGHFSGATRCHDVRNAAAIKTLSASCQEDVRHLFVGCNHEAATKCKNVQRDSPICPEVCNQPTKCGHLCQKRCGDCQGAVKAHCCQLKCDRMLFCGHSCDRDCHGSSPCLPCERKCAVRCVHSACPKKCAQPCASCVEPCDWGCEHMGKCPLVCGAPCSRLPCSQRCTKKLSCGHQCPSVCGEKCPDKFYCTECAGDDQKDQIVDMINLAKYSEHDVDDDPICILPCGHFFAMSTLDGHMGMNSAYLQDNDGNFIGVKSLRDSDVSEKPIKCPSCRIGIHSIARYGRILRLIELRGLERKHLVVIQTMLGTLKSQSGPMLFKRLGQVERLICKSPMRRVFEACRGELDDDRPMIPAGPLIKVLELRALAHVSLVKAFGDDNFKMAEETFQKAIRLATDNMSTRSAAQLRLSYVSFFLKWTSRPFGGDVKKDLEDHINWIMEEGRNFSDLVVEAVGLQRTLEDPTREIRDVIKAMNMVGGYNYGTSWNSHWYECPNGHPYFIGECGGAMETATCIECGAVVGGSSHQLNASNRVAGGVVAAISRAAN